MLPLEGMIVADFSTWFPGPYCARLLSDMGARVIKVERSIYGDPERQRLGTFNVINAGKESIAIDLSTSQGQEIAHRFIKEVDILIESYRPGITKKLGIDYVTVSTLKEDIIYCSITGFGQTGPLAEQPVHNLNALAETGVLSMGGQIGDPPKDRSGVWVADLSSATFAVISILGAAMQKSKTGKGAYIDVSMGDSCISWISGAWGEYFNGPNVTKKDVLEYPAYGVFAAEDKEYLAIGAIDDRHWLSLCKALDFTDYINNPALATMDGRRPIMDEINSRIAEKIQTRERRFWLDLLKENGVAANSVTKLEELPVHTHFLHRELINPASEPSPAAGVAFPAIVNNERWGTERSLAPDLGQDTPKVLKSLGYSDSEIDNLAKNGIIS